VYAGSIPTLASNSLLVASGIVGQGDIGKAVPATVSAMTSLQQDSLGIRPFRAVTGASGNRD
jgi:hypothetical protein